MRTKVKLLVNLGTRDADRLGIPRGSLESGSELTLSESAATELIGRGVCEAIPVEAEPEPVKPEPVKPEPAKQIEAVPPKPSVGRAKPKADETPKKKE